MSARAALPFIVKRSDETMTAGEFASTSETIHGLIRLESDRLVVQWRVYRETDRYGMEVRQQREVGEVREVEIPLDAVAKISVRRRWWEWSPRLILTAADLRAFETLAGQGAIESKHPGELVLTLRRKDALPAREFAADVALASAERLALGEGDRPVPERRPEHGADPEPEPGSRPDGHP